MHKYKYITLAILIMLFVILRLLILFTSIDVVYFFEEFYKGTIAKDLIEGLKMPFFDYQSDTFDGGSLLIGLLAVPFFVLFGQNLISLKLVAVCFYLGTMVLWYLFSDKFFNRKVAILTSLFFIFSPQLLTRFSLISMGYHSESIFFTIAEIFIFYQIFFNHKRSNLYFILFGLISGIGLWFAYIFFITLLTCLIFWFVFDKRFFLKRHFLIFMIAFIIGFSPWIYYGYTHNWSGMLVHGAPIFQLFSLRRIIPFLIKLGYLLTYDIRNAFFFEDALGLKGVDISTVYHLLSVISFICLLWSNRKSILMSNKEALFLFYPLVFALIYSSSSFSITHSDYLSYRHLVHLFPFMFMIISLLLYKMSAAREKLIRIFSFAIAIILIGFGLVSNLKLIGRSNFAQGLKYKGYSYYGLGYNVARQTTYAIDKGTKLIEKIPAQQRKFFCLGLGLGYGERLYDENNYHIKSAHLLRRVEGRYRHYLYPGLAWNSGEYPITYIQMILSAIGGLDKKYSYCFYETLGRAISYKYHNIYGRPADMVSAIKEVERLKPRVNREIFPWFYQGLGTTWAFAAIEPYYKFKDIMKNYVEEINSLTKEMPEDVRHSFFSGLGEVVGIEFGPIIIDKFLEIQNIINSRINEGERPYFYRGFGMGVGFTFSEDLNRCRDIINKVEEKYRPFCENGLEQFLGTFDL